jgi:murein DD-endopeptidase MepM/ murein hydrolase activator NlpD
MRFWVAALMVLALTAGADEIGDKTSALADKEKQEQALSRQLDDISKTLQKEEKSLGSTNTQIDKLAEQIASKQSSVDKLKKELGTLTKTNEQLLREQRDLEQKLIEAIAKDFSYFMASDGGYVESIDSIIANEALKKLSTSANKEIAAYADRYAASAKKYEASNSRLKSAREAIDDLEKKKKSLERLKGDKTKLIKNVKKEQDEYLERIKTLQREKRELAETLENLKIMAESAQSEVAIPENFESVRRLGSSYQSAKVKAYKGAKTIAPLGKFTVQQKFGDYVDPVYDIKIFNENVVLRSAVADDEVKNILDGKVVFAKETALLKNVVIVENANGIHTIYAHLSKIAPTIQVGDKIKKGYVIGRVERDLTLEVTQKNYHINPLDLITL